MSDLFHESVPDEWIDRVFAVMALAPQHTFQVLTKRPERMRTYMKHNGPTLQQMAEVPQVGRGVMTANTDWPLPNVWLGVSVEDQTTADERIPLLLDTPAAKRFISAEPLLGLIDLTRIETDKNSGAPASYVMNALAGFTETTSSGHHQWHSKLDWVIVGGESGPNARPMHPDWVRSLRDQCAAADVLLFFKQWGEWLHETQVTGTLLSWNQRNPLHSWSDEFASMRVGKKAAGALLDGREHREFPA